MHQIEVLPDEILERILLRVAVLEMLDIDESSARTSDPLVVLKLVCRKWYDIVGSGYFLRQLRRQLKLLDPAFKYVLDATPVDVRGVKDAVYGAAMNGKLFTNDYYPSKELVIVYSYSETPITSRVTRSWTTMDGPVLMKEVRRLQLPVQVRCVDELQCCSANGSLYTFCLNAIDPIDLDVIRFSSTTGSLHARWSVPVRFDERPRMSVCRKGNVIIFDEKSRIFYDYTEDGIMERTLDLRPVIKGSLLKNRTVVDVKKLNETDYLVSILYCYVREEEKSVLYHVRHLASSTAGSDGHLVIVSSYEVRGCDCLLVLGIDQDRYSIILERPANDDYGRADCRVTLLGPDMTPHKQLVAVGQISCWYWSEIIFDEKLAILFTADVTALRLKRHIDKF